MELTMNNRINPVVAGVVLAVLAVGLLVLVVRGHEGPAPAMTKQGMPADVAAEFNRRMQSAGVAQGQTAPVGGAAMGGAPMMPRGAPGMPAGMPTGPPR